MKELKWKPFWAILRISAGFIFMWPFLDKLFGLGMTTAPGKSWLAGGSPTVGFLSGTSGTFSWIFHPIAQSQIVTWLFMLGLLFVGITFILGIALKPGAIAGTIMLFLMWLSVFPPSGNPFMDYHWFYAFALITSALIGSGNYFGLGKWWKELDFVRKFKILE